MLIFLGEKDDTEPLTPLMKSKEEQSSGDSGAATVISTICSVEDEYTHQLDISPSARQPIHSKQSILISSESDVEYIEKEGTQAMDTEISMTKPQSKEQSPIVISSSEFDSQCLDKGDGLAIDIDSSEAENSVFVDSFSSHDANEHDTASKNSVQETQDDQEMNAKSSESNIEHAHLIESHFKHKKLVSENMEITFTESYSSQSVTKTSTSRVVKETEAVFEFNKPSNLKSVEEGDNRKSDEYENLHLELEEDDVPNCVKEDSEEKTIAKSFNAVNRDLEVIIEEKSLDNDPMETVPEKEQCTAITLKAHECVKEQADSSNDQLMEDLDKEESKTPPKKSPSRTDVKRSPARRTRNKLEQVNNKLYYDRRPKR